MSDNKENKEKKDEVMENDNILDGMREVIEFSESKADSDDAVFINDRAELKEAEDHSENNETEDKKQKKKNAKEKMKKEMREELLAEMNEKCQKFPSFIKKIYTSKIGIKCKMLQRTLEMKLRLVLDHPVIMCLLLAFFSIMFMESMSRRSFPKAVGFIFDSPVKFILNYLIVLAPFLIAFFVKKKLIPYFLFLAMWVTVGIVDFYMLSYRTTPFTGVDIDLDLNELAVAFNYLKLYESIPIIICIILAIGLILSLLFICPNSKFVLNSRLKGFLVAVAMWIISYQSVMMAVDAGILSLKFGNLAITYHENGITYSLLVTIVNTGMDPSEEYSQERIDDIVSSYADTETNEKEEDLPNIIFLQLESFIDPMEITNIECSEDPMPFYRSLREKYSSGYLVVPTIVAGTCNTEFEVITGMNLEFFGPGEYPYKTILKETTCESMAYNMRELGYRTHTIHNNKATFYSRHKIFSQLGFDTFTSIENMCDVEETPNGWAKDGVLVKSITDCLDSSEEKDLIYTVSVQCHGVYTTVLSEEETKISVSGLDDQAMTDSYNYYVNMVKEVDDVIRRLTEELSRYDEDIVLVMYGDHIPGLNLSDDVLESNNIYTTQYVIWDNMGLKKQDMEITSYQLAAEVFNRLNIHEGNIFKFHQENANSEDQASYQSKFYDLQYDMLYGDRNVYGGTNPFKATKIQYGVNDIIINKISFDEEYLYIEGENFNEFSNVYIGEEREDCELISSTLLKVEIKKEDIEEGSEIVIQQRNSADKKLRESEPYLFLG